MATVRVNGENLGSQIGKRDHATVLHACKTVDNLSSTDKQFRKYVEDLAKKYSEDPSAKTNEGDLSYFTVFRMVTPFENMAYKTFL